MSEALSNIDSQQIQRHIFTLRTDSEVDSLVSQSVIPSKKQLGGAKPFAFTKQGVAILSSVLTSDRAIEINIHIMRTFVQMHRFIAQNVSLYLHLKDPYLLDFLDLQDNFSEKDLENAILHNLEHFILELGSDFAFMARQKRLQIGANDYYLDLLFYHRKLKRLVLIELKLGEFKPEYKGQVELYLKWLAKHEQQADENPPIAILLCSSKDKEVVELMELEQDAIHVSEYWLQLPPKEVLQAKLHKAIEEATLRLGVGDE